MVYATALARFEVCNARITEETLIVRDTKHGGFRSNPFIKLQREAADLLLRAAVQLGLTPAARASLGIAIKDDADDLSTDNPWADFLSNG